jgi:hypothetical protein
MAPSTKKQKTSQKTASSKKPAGDFKRLKAKVGKRAPQKLSSTATDFRTSSIRMDGQQSLMGHRGAEQKEQRKGYDDAFGQQPGQQPGASSSSSPPHPPAPAPLHLRPKYTSISELPPVPNTGSKPLPLLLSLCTSHSSVKTRAMLVQALTDFLGNVNQSSDPDFRIDVADLHSPAFTPPLLSLALPVLQATLLDTATSNAAAELLPPLAPPLFRALVGHPGRASLLPHLPSLSSYLLAGLSSLSPAVTLASLQLLAALLERGGEASDFLARPPQIGRVSAPPTKGGSGRAEPSASEGGPSCGGSGRARGT